jgi:hypothetical protein
MPYLGNHEAPLQQLLDDPIVQLVMARDNVSASDLRANLDAARRRLRVRRTRCNDGNSDRPATQDGDVELTVARPAIDRPRRAANGQGSAQGDDDRAPDPSEARITAHALADHLTAINLYLAVALRACETEPRTSELRTILEKTAIQAARARSVILSLRRERIVGS